LFRRVFRPLFLTVAVAAGVGVAWPAAAADPALDVREEADRIMNLTAERFAAHPHVAPFDWSTDGCTASLPGYGETFRQPCMQHDFGYRNYGGRGELKLDPTERTRAWIDQRFLEEMNRVCDRPATPDKRDCKDNATAMWVGVTLFGGAFFY
jgi:hypothetical protein